MKILPKRKIRRVIFNTKYQFQLNKTPQHGNQDKPRFHVPPPNMQRDMVINEMHRMGINKSNTQQDVNDHETNRKAVEEMRQTFIAKEKAIALHFFCIVLYCIALYCIVLHCIVLKFHSSSLPGSCLKDWELYCIVLHCIFCIALHCIFLHFFDCIALHCIVLKFHCSRLPRSCLTVPVWWGGGGVGWF